jgi:DNA-binding CsgD family transcriptional regulator
VSSAGSPSARHEPPLERATEVAELDLALASAREGSGRCVAIEGAAGLGKTLLLSLATERAESAGMTVLRARGGELERRFPLGIALQLLEPYLSSATAPERRRVLAGAAAHAERLLSDRVRPPGAGGSPESALLHSLHWVAVNIAERRPLVIAVDDAHAADEASLRALLYTVERLEDLPLAVLLTARPRPASTGGGDALTTLVGQPLTSRLELAALSPQAIAAIVRAKLPAADDAFCAACARATGGNPFFARELLAELTAAGVEPTASAADHVGEVGPSTVGRAIAGRLERCSPGATPLAHAAAVLGDGAQLVQVATLAGLDGVAVATLAGELAEIDVLRPSRDLAFAHPVVRQAVYLGIPEDERARLHLAAAQLFDAGPSGDERAAAHLLHVPPSAAEWIVACLHAGAQRALAGGSPETAAQFLVRALEEPPPDERRAEILIDLGRAEALAGIATASDRLRAAVALLDQPQARARALAQLGQALYAVGDNPGAASAFDEGLRVLDGADAELAEELTAGYLGAARLEFRTREAAQTRFKDLLARTDQEATTPVQRDLLAQRALEHAMLGNARHDKVVAMIRSARSGDDLLREATADGVPYAGGAAALLFCDGLDDAEAMATAGLEDARRRSSVIGFAVMSTVRGASRYLRGDIARGLGDLEGGLERVELMVLVRPFAHGWMALAHLDRGELEQAARLVDRPDEGQDQYFTYNWALFARGRLSRMSGDPARALEDLQECGRRQLAVPAPSPAVLPWRSEAALAAHALGLEREARELAAEELRLARAIEAPRALGIALRVAGIVAGGTPGLGLLEDAVAVLAGSPSRLEHARALIDLGAAQRRAGDRALARATLREGLDAAHHFGAGALAAVARTELIAAGARPRRPAMRGADSLTPSELRVSELAERGLTNREIAQALFVSTKTVEFHLRNAYGKLRIRSRQELSGALRGGTPAPRSGAPEDGDGSPARRGAVV